MIAGRKPMPAEWRVITGSAKVNPERVNKNAPEAPAGEPVKPDDLDDIASAKWDEVTGFMRQMRTLSSGYGDLIAAYCNAFADYTRSRNKMLQEGFTVEGKNGPKPNPTCVVMARSRDVMVKLLAELGLTPSAKARLVVQKKSPVESRKREKA